MNAVPALAVNRYFAEHPHMVLGLHGRTTSPFGVVYTCHYCPSVSLDADLAAALEPYGVLPDRIPTAFNCFMNVPIDTATGKLSVLPPISKAGDHIALRAAMDLVIGMTACSAPASNGGSFKPIHYRIE